MPWLNLAQSNQSSRLLSTPFEINSRVLSFGVLSSGVVSAYRNER